MDYTVLLISVLFGFCIPSTPILCEFHYVLLKMTWAEAQHYCRVKHTDLATIGSTSDISRLNRPSSDTSQAWIGLSDDPDSWKGGIGNERNSWRWSATGETNKAGYHNWQKGQPDNYSAYEICVIVNHDGEWHDADCQHKFDFVCYDTKSRGQKTYTRIDSKLTWKDAQDYCRVYYQDLAMIENAEENTEMLLVKSTSVVWIGLYRIPWKWSDNSNSSFTNWQIRQPNFADQNCVFEIPNHLWYDGYCDSKLAFWCHGALKVKMTRMVMKIQTDADLSDPAINAQILQQLGAVLSNKTRLTDFNLMWNVQPRKQRQRIKENDDCN